MSARIPIMFPLACAATLLGLMASSSQANLLENSGFETDAVFGAGGVPLVTGWGSYGSGSLGTACAPDFPARTGIGSLLLIGPGSFTVPAVDQTFATRPGEVWDFQGYMLTLGAITSASRGQLKLIFSDVHGNALPVGSENTIIGTPDPPPWYGVLALPKLDAGSTTGEWIFAQAQVVAPAGAVAVHCAVQNVDETSQWMFFDDLQVTVQVVAGSTNFVSLSGSHLAPYTSWATAATNIQDAVDATVDGNTVLVTNGTYDTGGALVDGSRLTNRIAIIKAVTVRSVNGPDSTFIVGSGPMGDAAVRCAYVGDNARLEGFTLTNGHTANVGASGMERSGGGAWCEPTAVVSNCTISGNAASYRGGGVHEGFVQNCTILGNSAAVEGGGTAGGTIQNCILSGNTAGSGGGASRGTVLNCTISGNSTDGYGGGTWLGTVQNCIVYYNSATRADANCHGGTVEYTCTLPDPGGVGNITNAPGMASLINPHILPDSPCIDAGTNQAWMATALDIDGELRIQNGRVDIGCNEFYAGGLTGTLAVTILSDYVRALPGYSIGFEADIQGRPTGYQWMWGDGGASSNTISTSHAFGEARDYDVVLQAWNLDGTASATLTVQVVAGYTNYVSVSGIHSAPYETWTTAATDIQAAISANNVLGGVVLVTNGVYDTGWAVVRGSLTNRIAITNAVTVRSVDGPDSTFIVGSGPMGDAAVRCAYVGSGARLEGFTLTNGIASFGEGGGAWCEPSAVLYNCTISGNSAALGSGGGTFGGTIQHCTISGNTAAGGGGTYETTVQNCIISGNTAEHFSFLGNTGSGGGMYGGAGRNCIISGNTAAYGAGTDRGTVQNCSITGNSASRDGGGTYGGKVQNCTITGNSAEGYGGGAAGGTVENCIVYYNSATRGYPNCGLEIPGSYSTGTVEYTCTIPDPGGAGNISNPPQFRNWFASDFHLSATSPGIDAGTNQPWMQGATDLDGNPRIVGSIVDMGAYEWPLTMSVVDIKANGADGLVVLGQGEPLTVTASLVADPAIVGDTWILAMTPQAIPFDIFSYNLNQSAWVPWLYSLYSPSSQGPIPHLQSETLLQSSGLSGGFYLFYLGYDPVQNRWIDIDILEIDAVPVIIGN